MLGCRDDRCDQPLLVQRGHRLPLQRYNTSTGNTINTPQHWNDERLLAARGSAEPDMPNGEVALGYTPGMDGVYSGTGLANQANSNAHGWGNFGITGRGAGAWSAFDVDTLDGVKITIGDTDSDGDGIPDESEPDDADNNGVPDYLEAASTPEDTATLVDTAGPVDTDTAQPPSTRGTLSGGAGCPSGAVVLLGVGALGWRSREGAA